MRKLTKKQSDIIQYTFLVCLIIFTTYIVSTTIDIRLLSDIIKHIDSKYIIAGLLCIILYIIIESIIINIIIKSICNVNIKNMSIKIATLGLYYNLVTPFASGSQPMQIYVLSKYNIDLSKSMAIVTNKTIIFQTIVTLYCMLLFSINADGMYTSNLSNVAPLVMVGIVTNTISIVAGILIILSPNKVKYYLKKLMKVLIKYKTFKFIVDKEEKIYNYIDDYSKYIYMFMRNKKDLFLSIILTFIQLTIYFSITYFIYKSFSLIESSYITLLTLQVFLYMAVSPIPTPGNVGANEIGFLTVFQNVFPKEIIGYSVFLYGAYVYYFMLIISGIFTVRTHYELSKIDKNYPHN